MIKPTRTLRVLAFASLAVCAASPAWTQTKAASSAAPRSADYIVAVINNELVTQFEVEQRIARARDEAARSNTALPEPTELRKLALDSLINERVLITYARESGMKVDDQELERAIGNIASMNKLSVEQLRQRLREENIDYGRFRSNLKDQILSERVREREVQARIKITDSEVEDYLEKQRAGASQVPSVGLAQILVTVPDSASEATVAERLAKAQAAMAQLKAGKAFDQVAKEFSEDESRVRGGDLGTKPADRWPDLFMDAVKGLTVGQVTPEPIRSGAGFHVLKLQSRSEAGEVTVSQTRARHILLRPSARLSTEAAMKRLAEFREQIASGKRKFEDLAREFSEDGSAPSGGDLGWVGPGSFVPEFEEAMNRLSPGAMSAPIESRFGVHLIQVVERRTVPADPRQLREQARAALREQKYEPAYKEWAEELRARAYVEMREPPP
jgi:peptidyl-prolyl cis-trans isomerase SurA